MKSSIIYKALLPVSIITTVAITFFVKTSPITSNKVSFSLEPAKHNQLNHNIQIYDSTYAINLTDRVEIARKTINQIQFVFASGGKIVTVYTAKSSQVDKTINQNKLVAGVDGTFFGMNDPESSQIIGPVLSNRNNSGFIPGTTKDIVRIKGRPLVLIGSASVKFLPFDPNQHNTLNGVTSELSNVTDVFVSGGWLVKKGKPQTVASFGNLYKVNEPRRRAFWGLNAQYRPTLGISTTNIGVVKLGELLAKEGWKEAVMLDSGQSTSLAYKGKSLVNYTPRPVPHVVGLVE